MRRLSQVLLVLACLYGLYLIKSAMGINILSDYHLTDLFFHPIPVMKALAHKFIW
ncbi:hypothetical protein [Leptolyngbya sp. 'hensonii']|uniref:hypothetical protein n=1 Tax=Leptolyngbya sp. 'hensonii' TaxID=1922337 RepID=UPI000ACC8457|nr:hypothetical protein [Leptolyngbya sp. 'hensonii']